MGPKHDSMNRPSKGFFISGSVGAVQSNSYYSDTLITSIDEKYETQHDSAIDISAGYQWGTGQINSWNNIFIGTSINYYYFGKAIDPELSNDNIYYTQLHAIDLPQV